MLRGLPAPADNLPSGACCIRERLFLSHAQRETGAETSNKEGQVSVGIQPADALGRPDDAPITAAFYLPQFHAIPENDEWWGTGFTEWTNVGRAEPLFEGHVQPVTPAGPFGEYSLLDPDVVTWQTGLAAGHDVDAFIYYHYWFDGRRLLEQPLDLYLKTSETQPFALCWANENWTRRWDGKQHEVLMAQDYTDRTPADAFESFLPYLTDSRYLRLNGKAVLVVHRADHLPEPRRYADVWRQMAKAVGLGELWLVASETSYALDPREIGFDALAEFPPVGDSTLKTAVRRLPPAVRRGFKGRINSYDSLVESYRTRREPDFVRHPTVVPRWDNTARRGLASTLFIGSTPAKYGAWLADARRRERTARGADGIVFINAWNEWAEGAQLEPEAEFGDLYLKATRWDYQAGLEAAPSPPMASRRPNIVGLARAAASSAKGTVARMRSRG